jgi:hypothetical protein
MTYRLGSLPVLLTLTAALGFSQIIGIPGVGYPGGGYPGRGYPGQNGRFPGSRNQTPTSSLVGMLRNIDTSGGSSSNNNSLVLETDDNRIINVTLDRRVKYIGTSGGSARITDFQPGDHIEVDATQDTNDFYHAVKVSLLRQGTADERAAASKPIDQSATSSASSSGSSPGDDDPDRPRLHRAPSSGGDDTSTASNSSSNSASNSSSATDDPDRPRIRRAAPSEGDDSPRAEITPGDSSASASLPPASRDPDDPGPPVLVRGRPAPRNTSSDDSDATIADARPTIHAQEVNGVTRPPSAPVVDDQPLDPNSIRLAPSGDTFIDQARQAAFSFSETLPNYVVKEFTTRYETELARNRGTSWRALDTISADIVYQAGKENYKNFMLNGRPMSQPPEKTGSWSSGEFASTLQDIMSPITSADFHGKRSTMIANRSAFRYDFSVEQPNSHWHVEASGQSYQPAYTGSLWIDKENYRVLRIELSAQNMPRTFPLDQVESAVDYDYVLIGEQKFLLPVHSEALSCERGTSDCSRNVIEFRNYKKFGADTSITFDTGDPK